MENFPLIAAVEAGGTKIMCALVSGPRRILARHRIPTADPHITLDAAVAWLTEAQLRHGRATALGIASFGPADLTTGTIGTTPKPGWSGTPIAARLGDALGLPTAFDLDVAGAALAEQRFGAARGCTCAAYVTIGTGIGAGLVVDGRILHGRRHPEAGHVLLPPASDGFVGICPFHRDCLEGRCCGPALRERARIDPATILADHPVWAPYFDDLAAGMMALVAVASPERLVVGGSVAQGGKLGPAEFLTRLRAAMAARDGGYLGMGSLDWLVAPSFGDDAGLVGAAALAWDLLGDYR